MTSYCSTGDSKGFVEQSLIGERREEAGCPVDVPVQDDEVSNLRGGGPGPPVRLAVQRLQLQQLLDAAALAEHVWDGAEQRLETPESPGEGGWLRDS